MNRSTRSGVFEVEAVLARARLRRAFGNKTMRIKDAGFHFRQESTTDAFVMLWGETSCFAFLVTKQESDGLRHNCGWAVFRSKWILQLKHGHPNDEAYPGHLLYPHGLDRFDIAEVEDTPWMDEIKAVNAVQFPNATQGDWRCRHHIFPLKEITLEVLWRDFEYEVLDEPFEEVKKGMLQWMAGNQ